MAASSLPRTKLNDLAHVALQVLPAMRDEASGLFAHKTFLEGDRYVNREPNVLYSVVSLVGILQQRHRAPDEVVPLGPALDACHAGAAQGVRISTLGNLVWACTMADDRRGASVTRRLREALDPPSQATSDLGQALYGLVAAAESLPEERDAALRASEACVRELLARFSASADLFRGSPVRVKLRPRRGLIERGITSFANQVYPLHGLASYYRFTGERAPDALVRVAGRVVDAQGPRGQWWWLYSPNTSRVLEGYPVYSVHQDGMAFLGLVPLSELGLGRYDEALALGLDWLFGANELSTSLVEDDPPFVFRCIQRTGGDADGPYGMSKANFARVLARSARPGSVPDQTHAEPERLEVLRECRSYHLGWILYADALAARSPEAQLGSA
jgi:hypothetical protein